jgi:hypothetical protein
MANRRKLIFELTSAEKKSKFESILNAEIQRAAELNLPFVYRNELCTEPNMFIHRYPDGRTLLIEQDRHNSEERIVRTICELLQGSGSY